MPLPESRGPARRERVSGTPLQARDTGRVLVCEITWRRGGVIVRDNHSAGLGARAEGGALRCSCGAADG
eukprot:5694331-Prymnesium_polylepis.1